MPERWDDVAEERWDALLKEGFGVLQSASALAAAALVERFPSTGIMRALSIVHPGFLRSVGPVAARMLLGTLKEAYCKVCAIGFVMPAWPACSSLTPSLPACSCQLSTPFPACCRPEIMSL